MLFPKTPLFLLPGRCCSSLHCMERRSRGCPLMAGAERQNAIGNLCRLSWDGPPAPKETFHQLPLALLRLPGAAARREQPKQHWPWGTTTSYTAVVRGGWFSGSLLRAHGCHGLQSMAHPAQLCSGTNRCAHLTHNAVFVNFLPSFLVCEKFLSNFGIFQVKIITVLFWEVYNFLLQMYSSPAREVFLECFNCTQL